MAAGLYVVQAKENGTKIAVEKLRAASVPVYMPFLWERVREGRTFRARPELRFPGYIFVMIDLEKGEDVVVRQCAGVEGILPLGGSPELVRSLERGKDKKFIDKDGSVWRAAMQGYEIDQWVAAQEKPQPRKDIHVGDHVMIDMASNEFCGKRGEVIAIQRYEAKVLIGWFMCWVKLIHLKKEHDVETLEVEA